MTGDVGDLETLPAAARRSTGGGEPRTPASWVIWSTCGEGSKAETARANGGRDAGWILLDDLLADPGIRIGDHDLSTCSESVALLEGSTNNGDEASEPAYALARQLVAAELNLTAGAELSLIHI